MTSCPGYCGSCPTPCFLRIVVVPEVAYSDLADDLSKPDADALGCKRWENPSATCSAAACIGKLLLLARDRLRRRGLVGPFLLSSPLGVAHGQAHQACR